MDTLTPRWIAACLLALGSAALRYHVQLFSGYGDSLIDDNRRRNVLSVGLSLVDWYPTRSPPGHE